MSYNGNGPDQDVYYIHEFQMESDYNDKLLKHRILDELPNVSLELFHVRPDILAYYSEPIMSRIKPNPELNERKEIIKEIMNEKLDTVREKMNGIFNSGEIPKSDSNAGNIVKFADSYQFTEDEENVAMDRPYSGTYPAEAKNQAVFEFYEANGFVEMGNSRLLYKCVDADEDE
jgi:hypothetical protein